MRLTSKLTTLTAGLALAALTSVSAYAQQVTLTISSWAPPTHGVNAILWPAMIKQMEEATDGRVTAVIKYGLASPPAQYDLILDGAADITWIFNGYTPGRFVASKIVELPGYVGSAEAASVAYWRAYDKFLAPLNEYKGVKVVGLMTHGVGVLHSANKVTSLDEISGMKLRLGGGVSGDVGAALGATGIRVPAPKVYETLASNAADGVMMPMEGKASFKLFEVAQNTYMVPGGFYRGAFAIIMNQEKFDSLSAADQAALDSVFGENMSRIAGSMWDQIDKVGMDKLMSSPDNSMNEASAADAAKWQEMTKPIIASVLAEVSAKGVDAAKVRDYIATEMKNY
jgi:TRAP-type C4-dicarboxylate transport system substrate-binding protein